MSITNLKQNNPAWSSYPYAGETMGPAGCGPTAIADVLGLNTPVPVAKWLTEHGYASNGSGTYHSGIPAAIKAYGHEAEQISGSSLAGVMSCAQFNEFKKSIQAGNCGIILFGGVRTGCKNNYWCSAGHYCACVGYKDGKYLIYDPAYGARDGYHFWEADIAGNVKHLFTTNIKWSPGGGQKGSDFTFTVSQIKMGSTGVDVLLLQEILRARGFTDANGKEIALDRSFGPATHAALIKYQKSRGGKLVVDGICGPATWRDLLGKA